MVARLSDYWVIDQVKFAADLIFTSRKVRASFCSLLLYHAVVNFSAEDILTYLGGRFHPRFEGEPLTFCQKHRRDGARINTARRTTG
jgi:hypothetical protein